MVNFLGLTTVAALDEAVAESERLKSSLDLAQGFAEKWKKDFYENNETIERLTQFNNTLNDEVARLTMRETELEKQLADALVANTNLEQRYTNLEEIDSKTLEINVALTQEVQRIEAENRALNEGALSRLRKIEIATQELDELKVWVKTLEVTNKEQAEKLGKQVTALNQEIEAHAATSLLYNQATVDIAALKLANKRYQEAVKIAADNFILEITN